MLIEHSSKPKKSFSELMHNPKQDYAEGALATLLYQLEHQFQMEPDMLADVLFDYALLEAKPDVPATGAQAVRWFYQLHRFRDRITEKLDAVSEICDEIRARDKIPPNQ